MDELRVVVETMKPDVVALTETWTNDDIDNNFLMINGYEIIERKDRTDTDRGRGGGVLVYVNKKRCAWKVEIEGDFSQFACVRIKGAKRDLEIVVVYRSPNSNKTNDDSLCALMRKTNPNSLILGDFNYPGIRWSTGGSDAKSREFLEVVEDEYMSQHVDGPTHINGNVLDLVITRDDEMVESVTMEGRLGKSDHEMILTRLKTDATKETRSVFMRDLSKANYKEMKARISLVNWSNEMEARNIEECWLFFKDFLDGIVDEFVPLKRKKGRRATPWLNKEIKAAIKEKKKAWDEWKRRKRETDKREYKKCENRVKKLIRNRKNAVDKQVARDSKTNPKRFFSFINSAKRSRSSIGPLTADGELVTDPRQQAEVLNNYFSSVFTRSDVKPPTKDPSGIDKLNDVDMSAERIKNAISRIHEYASPRPDDVTNKIIVELKDEIADPLSSLVQKSLDEMMIPNEWRMSNVTPIYKLKGSKADPEITGRLASRAMYVS